MQDFAGHATPPRPIKTKAMHCLERVNSGRQCTTTSCHSTHVPKPPMLVPRFLGRRGKGREAECVRIRGCRTLSLRSSHAKQQEHSGGGAQLPEYDASRLVLLIERMANDESLLQVRNAQSSHYCLSPSSAGAGPPSHTECPCIAHHWPINVHTVGAAMQASARPSHSPYAFLPSM